MKYNVSLINTNVKRGLHKDMFASNIMTSQYISHRIDKVFLVDKPKEKEKGSFNNHKTVKPLLLFKYLINLTTRKTSIILDPFIGNGTTAVACEELRRKFIGVEINKQYINIANKRLASLKRTAEQQKKNLLQSKQSFL